MVFDKKSWEFDDVVTEDDANRWEVGIDEAHKTIGEHAGNKENPHGVTKNQIGLGNVDNIKQETPSGAQKKANEVKNWVKDYSIGTSLQHIDPNVVNKTGFYVFTENTPTSDGAYYGYHLERSIDWAAQFVMRGGTDKAFFRTKNLGKWQEWHEVVQKDWLSSFGIKDDEGLYVSDLNNINKSGFYTADENTANVPANTFTQVFSSMRNNSAGSQLAICRYSGAESRFFFRSQWSGTWTNWEEIATKEQLELLASHARHKGNPHNVTKSQIGLGNVDNYGTSTQSQAETGSHNHSFMTPLRTKQAIDKLAPTPSKADIGLGDVDNIKQASKVEFDSHKDDKNNPHSVTKEQVGLSDVDNVKQMPLRTTRFNGVDLNNFKDPGVYALGENIENSPSRYCTLTVFTSYSDRIVQMITDAGGNEIFYRSWKSTVWSNWLTIASTDKVTSEFINIIEYRDGSIPPNMYPKGITIFEFSDGLNNGFPVGYGTVTTIKSNNTRAFQICHGKDVGLYTRGVATQGDRFLDWVKIETERGSEIKIDALQEWIESFGIGSNARSANFDTVNKTGFYGFTGGTKPFSTGMAFYGYHLQRSSDYASQFAITSDGYRAFYRGKTTSGWNKWHEMVTKEGLQEIEYELEEANTIINGGLKLSDGIFEGGLEPSFSTANYIGLSSGNAIIGGLPYYYEENNTSHDVSGVRDGKMYRYVVQLDLKTGNIKVVKKEEHGKYPPLIRNTEVYELSIATVESDPDPYMAYKITDTRQDETICGFVKPLNKDLPVAPQE